MKSNHLSTSQNFGCLLSMTGVMLCSSIFLNQAYAAGDEADLRAMPARKLFSRDLSPAQVNQGAFGLQFGGPQEFPGTNSYRLKWLETEGEARANWLAFTRSESAYLKFLPETEKIRQVIGSRYEYPLVKETLKTETNQFQIIRPEWNKNEIVVRKNLVEGGSDQVIASETLFFPNSVVFSLLQFSPDKGKLVFLAALNGSMDNQQAIVYDLREQKITHQFEVNGTGIKWLDSQSLIFDHPDSNSVGWASEVKFLDGRAPEIYLRRAYLSWGDWTGFLIDGSEQVELQNKNDAIRILKYPLKGGEIALDSDNYLGNDEQYFYFSGLDFSTNHGAIYRLKKESGSIPEKIVVANSWSLTLSDVDGEELFLQYSKQGKNRLVVISKETQSELLNLNLPSCCALNVVSWSNADKKELILSFTNILGVSQKIQVPLQNPLNEQDLQASLIQSPTVELEVELKLIESFDGYQVPVTIIQKKGLLRDGQRPVYMETYGGFNSAGYLTAPLSKIKLEFIKNGGVYVGTGVRGGNEAGAPGYLSAIKDKKLTSMKDLIAVAQSLVKDGVTQSQKIVSYGASNGGFVVASAGRLSPESFGIVIPLNGVHDQLSFSQMDRWGQSWTRDYGDPLQGREFLAMLNRSPLEIAKNPEGSCQFLIVNGENDTRVNKIHSYKLKAVMDDYYPGKALLISGDHSGHGAITDRTGKGQETAAMVWSFIFNYFGMSVGPKI